VKCPIDQVDLQMTERQGIEIDYCPTCRGIWLDRGELDKIIERSTALDSRGGSDQGDYERQQRPSSSQQPGSSQQKKRSFLSDLFEFD
jgi:Zn-finger nucleic acid-binding protein